MKNFVALAAFVCAVAAIPVRAQEAPIQRGYAGGIAGLTFGSEVDALFGGEAGFNVAPDLFVYGSANHMRNVLPTSVQNDLDAVSQLMTVLTGVPWEFSATLRAFTVSGGMRYVVPTSGSVRPYVQGGLGVASLRFRVTEIDFGDMTDDIIADGVIDSETATKFVVELGGGVQIPLGSTYIDAGYRFGRINEADAPLNFSRAFAGFGVRF